jgi:hypothetical protein
MSNNKQSSSIDFFWNQLPEILPFTVDTETAVKLQEAYQQAKEMENEKHEKFNKFLNDEKQLGISDLKTVERIQWYYNTYFNETYGEAEQF